MGILIFGRSGQIATELSRLLPGPAHRFLGRTEADLVQPGAAAAAIARAAAECSLETVVNAAAWTAVDAAENDEAGAFRLNAEAPGEMAAACAARGIPFLHVSTDYVFDGFGARPWRPDDATAPLSAYGRSKGAGEEAVRGAGGAHAILRTSWVFSARGANFVRTMLRLGAERATLRVVADQVGGPTPAADIAAALLAMAAALRERPELSGSYHFAGAPEVSWAGFARAIFARAGLACAVEEIPTDDWPTPARRPLNSRLDCATTEAAFGLARPDWRAGLDAVLAELGALRERA